MAEGLLRRYGGSGYAVFSAGTSPSRVHPLAIEVMAEDGIDISGQRSKHVDEFLGQDFDAVISTCDEARDRCPVFTGSGLNIHWDLEDPAEAKGSREEELEAFRKIRDRLLELIQRDVLGDAD
ncbi:MAG: arsenate reductase ArsC [Proteobacteria bacterium]|nr:arsenate reductase ArsC [Pseudomonadota bacterium]NIS70275.1 arsenate reductase ArsC [Pseudomonadota bacterium]